MQFDPRLFQVGSATGAFVIEEIAGFTQEDLQNEDVMLLDAYDEIFVWMGNKSSKNEKAKGEKLAIEYMQKLAKNGRDVDMSMTIILAGRESGTFKRHFPDWDDDLSNKWRETDPETMQKKKEAVEAAKAEAIGDKPWGELLYKGGGKLIDPEKQHFSLAELQGKFPEGVISSFKEVNRVEKSLCRRTWRTRCSRSCLR